jgi:hypothetical protein
MSVIWFAPDRKPRRRTTLSLPHYYLSADARFPERGTAALAGCLGSMATPDDIPLDSPPSQTERPIAPKDGGSRRKIGPESELRGGPEATDANAWMIPRVIALHDRCLV